MIYIPLVREANQSSRRIKDVKELIELNDYGTMPLKDKGTVNIACFIDEEAQRDLRIAD